MIAYGRYSASEIVDLLERVGFELAPATLRQWKRRGRLSPGRGYDLDEVARQVRVRHDACAGQNVMRRFRRVRVSREPG